MTTSLSFLAKGPRWCGRDPSLRRLEEGSNSTPSSCVGPICPKLWRQGGRQRETKRAPGSPQTRSIGRQSKQLTQVAAECYRQRPGLLCLALILDP